MYTQFLTRSFGSPASIRNYVSGVKLIHIVSGFPFPHLQSIEFSLLMKGIVKLNPFIPRQALPITPAILLDILAVLDLSQPLDATLWCAFVLSFFLFARKSNMVPPSANKFDPAKHLCRRDIILGTDQVLIYIKWSKTIQAANRYLLVPLVSIPNHPLCPLRAVLNMFRLIPASPHHPAFLIPAPQGLSTLTHATFTKHLRRVLELAGHNPSGFSGHSFRRGGASFALSIGVPGELIMSHGDWKSACYLRYIDSSVQDRQCVSKLLANACSQL